jgi:AraC-like DNA-binding protein
MGKCYSLNPKIGKGYYWIYSPNNLFSIVIHDFYFSEDYYYDNQISEYFSVSYYESVSGEELNPYKKLTPGSVRCLWCNNTYRAIFHKNMPVLSIGIEFMPDYCDKFLAEQYSDDYINPREALLSINETTDFPEMTLLLHQLYNYRGTGMPGKLFYEGKVAEAMSLICERYNNLKSVNNLNISKEDLQHLYNVTSYINDHYAYNLTLDELSRIACMGLTKFKKLFKQVNHSTVTEYIQQRRIGQAEHLLTNTDLTIGQIANIVGYKSASRFSELFKKSNGIRPLEYQHLSKKQ